MLPAETSYKIYTGLDGKPLTNGYVYFGQPSQNPVTHPATVYWDAAGTEPALQPLRTLNGYIVRAGTPANVFVNGAYSQLVQDSKRRQVFFARTSTEFSIAGTVQQYFDDLESEAGSNNVGFKMAEAGTRKRSLQSKGRDFLSANDYPGVDPTGVTECTAALLAFVAGAKARYRGIEFSGVYKVTQLLLDTVNSVHFRGDVSFIGAATGTFDAVLEIKNAQAMCISGDLVVSGSSNPGYECGLKIWTSLTGSTSLLDLSSVSAIHVKRGIQIGDPTVTGRLLSEITVHGGYTFDCPNPLIAYGTQTFVNLVGVNYQSTPSTSFPSAEEIGILAIGANITQTGGELLHTTSAAGSAVEIRPILDGTVSSYGSYNGTGVLIETAAPLLKTTNPAPALASPQPGIASGFVHCRGYHGQNMAPFVSTDAGFNGDVVFSANDFYTVLGRTQANINCAAYPNIWCDDKSFGKNFLSPLGGVTGGGILHFSHRMILSVTNLAGQLLPNATETTLKYSALNSTANLGRFQGQYSALTGIFTVPPGGLKDVHIICQQNTGSITAGDLYIEINGVIGGYGVATASGFPQISYHSPQLAAGDQIKVVLFNTSSGPQVAGSSALDFLHILASN